MNPELQSGTYYANLVPGHSSGKSSTGTPYIRVALSITNILDINTGKWVQLPMAKERSVYLYTSEAAWPYSEEKLRSIEFNGDFADPGFGKPGATVTCKIESYQGKERERWDFPGGTGDGDPLDAEEVIKLNSRWKRGNTTPVVPAATPAPVAVATAPAAPAPPVISETDIPF